MATRGRKPKPTKLRLVTGNPGKRPVKRDDVQPRGIDLPMPPPFLSDEAKVEWGRTSEALHRLGLLTELDTSAFEAYCQAYGRWQQAERVLKEIDEKEAEAALEAGNIPTRGLLTKTKNGNSIQNPLVGIANRAQEMMRSAAADLGMNPSVRARLSPAEQARPTNPTAKFFD